MDNQNNSRITRGELNILMMHLVRSPRVVRTAASILDPERHFLASEYEDQIVWSIVRDFFVKFGQIPTYDQLWAEISQRLQYTDTWQYQDIREAMIGYINRLYGININSLFDPYALQILERFLNERELQRKIKSIDTINSPEAVEEFMRDLQASFLKTRVRKPQAHSLGAPGQEFIASHLPEPTGLVYIDTLTQGGLSPGSVVGMLGRPGGGKTLFGHQFMDAKAKQQRNVLYCLYEQPISGDIVNRMYALQAGTTRDYFKMRNPGSMNTEIEKRWEIAKNNYGRFMRHVDMSGTDDEAGHGGPTEVEAVIIDEIEAGRPPSLVVIDWLLPMVAQWMTVNANHVQKLRLDIRTVIIMFINEFKKIAPKHNLIICVLHQLDTKAAAKAPGSKPKFSEAAECKGFAYFLQYCFGVGTLTKESLGWFTMDKARDAPPGEVIVQMIDGLKFKMIDPANVSLRDGPPKFRHRLDELPNVDDFEGRL